MINEEKILSALQLVKASGELTCGLMQCKRLVLSECVKYLFIAYDLEKKEVKALQFLVPDKASFTKDEVDDIFQRYRIYLVNNPAIKKPINIKKQMAILKGLAQQQGIPVVEGLTQEQLGRITKPLSGKTSCLAVTDPGRAKAALNALTHE